MKQRVAGRKPVGNFFVKRELQMTVILRIVTAALVATIVSAATIVLVYYLQHRSVLLYQLHETGSLSRSSIFGLILPSLIISIVVNLILAVCIGLYASRKYAVPVYKLEQWAQLLRSGKLNVTLRFREQKRMRELSDQFNSLTGDLRDKFLEVKKLVAHLKNTGRSDDQVLRVEKMVEGLDLSVASSDTKLDATGVITK